MPQSAHDTRMERRFMVLPRNERKTTVNSIRQTKTGSETRSGKRTMVSSSILIRVTASKDDKIRCPVRLRLEGGEGGASRITRVNTMIQRWVFCSRRFAIPIWKLNNEPPDDLLSVIKVLSFLVLNREPS